MDRYILSGQILEKYHTKSGHFQKALAIVREKMGEEHPYVETILRSIIGTIEEGAAAGDAEMRALQERMSGGR